MFAAEAMQVHRHTPLCDTCAQIADFAEEQHLLLLVVLAAPHALAARATTRSLGGADRYLTFVTTDKPFYRPGEQVLVRGAGADARVGGQRGRPAIG